MRVLFKILGLFILLLIVVLCETVAPALTGIKHIDKIHLVITLPLITLYVHRYGKNNSSNSDEIKTGPLPLRKK